MRGEFNGLKALILNNNPSAYYVYCFAYRLQLTLVVVIKKHNEVGDVFNFISSIINIVGALYKRLEVIREKQYARIIEGLENEEISNGRDLNQETSLKRYGDTRWGSHYVTIFHLLAMFSSVLNVLDDRFTEMSTELLIYVACLNPSDSFSIFNKEKLICLTLFYRSEFSITDLIVLGDQFDTCIIDLHGDDEFFGIEFIASIVEKMVKTKKNLIFSLVYMLIKLSLLLPVETATLERVFSAMHTVKSKLQKRMGDKWMNDSLVVYIEKNIFDKIDNETIMKRF
ncbi:zinc finger MYM-type protein 1-like [Populus alba x Populus x berolinensis]|uniref:Zinc finger MYM-type protein 1-like n=1 Tax=Populus alba x Populus x berolinensis TaxID=444605 RepID=A0AAD6RKM0_9ROSI|nr:zinc finger MYM-type protein 1-like [Populus alba x Populus x berolinensis]